MTTIKQLRYLDALARFGHYGKAAAHCAISQPALSMQIQELERQLRVQLIERRSKGVALTEPGRQIAERAQKILAAVRDIADFAGACGEPLSTPIRLGVIPTVAPYILPPLLPLLRQRYPKLELHIRETHTEQLVSELAHGELDLLLLALPLEHPDLASLTLFEDRFLLAMPPEREGNGMFATPEQIAGDRLLLLEEGHCLREQALSFCHLRQVSGIDTFGASNLSTLVQLVANGMGLTFLPEISVDVETRRSPVKVMRFAPPEPKRQIGLAWRATSPREADFVTFGQHVIEARPVPITPRA